MTDWTWTKSLLFYTEITEQNFSATNKTNHKMKNYVLKTGGVFRTLEHCQHLRWSILKKQLTAFSC